MKGRYNAYLNKKNIQSKNWALASGYPLVVGHRGGSESFCYQSTNSRLHPEDRSTHPDNAEYNTVPQVFNHSRTRRSLEKEPLDLVLAKMHI